MPVVKIRKEKILLKYEMSAEEFENKLFDFGLEIDGLAVVEGEEYFKVEVPANRFDLLCTEGLCRALDSYLFNRSYEDIKLINGDKKIIYKEVEHKRKYVAGAIIRNIKFDEERFTDFIEFQEHLHFNLGRDRKYISMGTHDNDKIKWPVIYRHHENMHFIPLNQTDKISCENLKSIYAHDKKFSKYFTYERNEHVFVDSNNQLLSYPPIINSEYSKITVNTKNIFVDVTGSDELKVMNALKLILYNFRGEDNEVEIVNINGINHPKLDYTKYILTKEEVNRELDLQLSNELIMQNLNCMMHNAKLIDGQIICMTYDVRQDILHKCDLIEDIAIKYGINNFPNKLPNIDISGELINQTILSNTLRTIMVSCGYLEILSMVLLSREENKFFGENLPVLNPNSKECESIRTSLFPGLLKSIRSNQHLRAPFKIFEVGDVVVDCNNDVGYINERRLAVLIAGKKDFFEDLQGVVSLIFKKLNLPVKYNESKNKIYLNKRAGAIFVDGVHVGDFGIINPEIISSFKISFIITGFEISLNKI